MSAEITALTLAPATDHQRAAQNLEYVEATHRWDECGKSSEVVRDRNVVLAKVAAAWYEGGAPAVIKAASGSNDGRVTRAWELAMNAVHGRLGVHQTRFNESEQVEYRALQATRLVEYLGVLDAQLSA